MGHDTQNQRVIRRERLVHENFAARIERTVGDLVIVGLKGHNRLILGVGVHVKLNQTVSFGKCTREVLECAPRDQIVCQCTIAMLTGLRVRTGHHIPRGNEGTNRKECFH
jgi:hypothetical protein